MKNKKVLFLGLGLLLIVSTLVISIAAWLTDVDETPDTTFTVGDVEYTIVSDFIDNGIIVPGQELIANVDQVVSVPISLINSSTVVSELRIRVIVTRKEGEAAATEIEDLDGIFTTSTEGDFIFATGWVKSDDEEQPNTWYYTPGDPADPVIAPAPTTVNIPVLSSLKLDGSKVGNDFSNDVLTIKFIFEAKQANYVEWSHLTELDFTTGT